MTDTKRDSLFVKSEKVELEDGDDGVEDDNFFNRIKSEPWDKDSSENGKDWDAESSNLNLQEKSELEFQTTRKTENNLKVQMNQRNTRESRSGDTKRTKKVNEMTAEERELIRQQWRERTRRKAVRQAQLRKELETTEQLENEEQTDKSSPVDCAEEKERKGEAKNGVGMMRIGTPKQKKKKVSEMTPEELEKVRESWNRQKQRRKERRLLLKASKKSDLERERLKRSQWSDEQRKEHNDRNKLYYFEKKARMTEAQLTEWRMQACIRYLTRKAKMTPEELEERKLKKREYQKMQRRKKRGMEMEPETDQKPEKEITKSVETQKEPKENFKERKKLSNEKIYLKKRAAIQEMMEKGMTPNEISARLETPEQRERRLQRLRKHAAKIKMRKKMEAAGASEEEIEAQIKYIDKHYVSKRALRAPKICPERWRPVDEARLAKISTLRKKKAKKTFPRASEKAPVPLPNVMNNDTSFCGGGNVNSNIYLEQLEMQPDSHAQHHLSHDRILEEVNVQQTPSSYHHQPVQPFEAGLQFKSPQYEDQVKEPTSTGNFEDPGWNYDSDSAGSSTCELPVPPITPAPESNENPTQCLHWPIPSNLTEPGKRKAGRPRKNALDLSFPVENKERENNEGAGRPTRNPLKQRRKGAIRDTVCDECGIAYNSLYLRTHKNNMHHVDFKNGECLVCGQKFNNGHVFYSHWKKEHSQMFRSRDHTDTKKSRKLFVCESCGKTHSCKSALDMHRFQKHGDDSVKLNFLKCPLCPPDSKKVFRAQFNLEIHMQRAHVGHDRIKCCRCSERFKSVTALNSHIQETHPESYWPCKYCGTVKFSVWGLNLHLTGKQCKKFSHKDWLEWRRNPENVCFQYILLPCEFCGLKYKIRHLKGHYRVVHNACEDKFKCFICEKEFVGREYWGVHMLEFHNMDLEECKERVSKLFAHDRSNMNIKMENERLKKVQNNRRKKDEEDFSEVDFNEKEGETKVEIDEAATRGKVGSSTENFWNGKNQSDGEVEEQNQTKADDQKCFDRVGAKFDTTALICPFCNVPKNTKIGLDFHVSMTRCTKLIREDWIRWTSNPNYTGFDRFSLQCEICNKLICCMSLSSHYKNIHKVTENKLKCFECERVFSQRQTWGVHMIEDHLMDVEEVKDKIRKVNVDEATMVEVLKMIVFPNKIGRKKMDQYKDNGYSSADKRRKRGTKDSDNRAVSRNLRGRGNRKIYNAVDESEKEVGQSDTGNNKKEDNEESKKPIVPAVCSV